MNSVAFQAFASLFPLLLVNVVFWEQRAGTVTTTVEVPAGGSIDPRDDVTRSGRVEKADLRA